MSGERRRMIHGHTGTASARRGARHRGARRRSVEDSMTRPSTGSSKPLPNIRCWCSATSSSAPATSPLSAGGSARRASTRWSNTATRSIPEVSWLTNVEEDGKVDWYGVKRATDWHTDSTYEEELPLLAMLHALEIRRQRAARCSPTCAPPMTRCREAMKERLAGLVGLHGRSDGPAGERLYGDEEGRRTEKKYRRAAAPGGRRASGDRPPDPVRQPDAHARLRRDGRATRPGS